LVLGQLQDLKFGSQLQDLKFDGQFDSWAVDHGASPPPKKYHKSGLSVAVRCCVSYPAD
jgi:hypothetical protein